MFLPSFYDLAVGKQIGETVEPLARKRGITRGDMDKWALRSHRRARAAQAGGRLGAEIVAVGGVREDDAVLPEAREGRIGRARSAFGKGGEVTSGNTHSITDGASALIIAGERSIPTGAEPLGRVASCAYVGMAPDQMGAASVPAIQEVLKRAGWRLAEVDLFEINETFAAQLLIDIGDLGIDPERVNVNGGSIAIGHPFAGTGGRLVLGLLQELCRRKLKRGVAAICVGAGQGVAVAVERG